MSRGLWQHCSRGRSPMSHAVIAVVFAWCCCCHVSQALSPVSTLVNWDSVPSTAPSSRSLNSANLGQCICDLTNGGCDPDCCCDPDCTTEEVSLFATCLDQTVSSADSEFCYTPNSGTSLVRINSNGGTLDQIAVGWDAVCLIRNNFPTGTGAYFSVPVTVSKPATSILGNEWFIPDITPSTSSGFSIGDRLPLVRFLNNTGTPHLQNVGSGYLSVPYGGPRGACSPSYQQPVTFLTPVTSGSCTVQGTTSAACSLLSLDRFTQIDAIAVPGSIFPLIVLTIHVKSATTGELLYTIDSLPLRNSSFETLNANRTQATPNSTNATLLSTFWDSATSTCVDAVTFVRTTISYDVTATPMVRNVTREVFIETGFVASANGVTQRHQVLFVRGGSTTPTGRSGNPGFIEGNTIPAGVLLTSGTKTAIQERLGGFSIPSGGSSCYNNRYRSVAFMHNVYSSGCYMDISELELQSRCASPGGTVDLLNTIMTLPSQGEGFDVADINTTTSVINRVAMTGDALDSDPSSWVSIQGLPIVPPAVNPYNSMDRSCSNIVVGISYSFIVARAGAESNPQDVIVGAFADPIIGTWKIRNESDYGLNAVTRQYFRFRVKFERFDPSSQTTVSRRIVAPPILPAIDDTVFYPFRMP